MTLETDESFRLYPNPTHDIIAIQISNAIEYSIDLFSNSGHKLESIEVEGPLCYDLNLSSYRSGIYFIHIRSKDVVQIRKIIKL